MLYRHFETQEAIDLAYDPSKTADGAAAMARYKAMSAATMADLKVHADLRFGQSLAETLDLFPAQTPGAPLHVLAWRWSTTPCAPRGPWASWFASVRFPCFGWPIMRQTMAMTRNA